MANHTSLDEMFEELNTIELSQRKKREMWEHIELKTKRKRTFLKAKHVLVVSAAIMVFSVLAINLLDTSHLFKGKSASEITKQAKPPEQPAQPLSKSQSAGWEAISRLRTDYGTIEKIETNQGQLSVTVKRINSFGSDTDPVDSIVPDTDSRTYLLKTSEEHQILHLKINQKILLLNGQYEKTGSSDWFWAAEVLGEAHPDGKLYDASQKLLNLTISSQAKVENGVLEIKK